MKESYLKIRDFKDNVKNLIEKVNNLKIENNKLSNDFNVLNTLHQNTINDFDGLKAKYDALKIGKACNCMSRARIQLHELFAMDALKRNESCGGHFREEFQTKEGEAMRMDQEFSYVSAWENKGEVHKSKLHKENLEFSNVCLLYTSPSPRDATLSRMPSSA